MPRRDRWNNAALLGLEGELPWRPVGDRKAELRRVLAGQRNDLCELLGAELARRAATRLVGQHVDDQRLELLVGRLLAPLRIGEAFALVAPTVSPAQDPLWVNPECGCLLDRRLARSGPKHYLDALRDSPLDGALSVQPLEDRALTRGKFERWSASSHSPTLILATPRRNFLALPPARTRWV